ncbi:MAG TPA: hypothetical protein VHS06_09965 [Chloroflexota bacterium]|nr:hypothetical protein [Chloroflexota bacterium]
MGSRGCRSRRCAPVHLRIRNLATIVVALAIASFVGVLAPAPSMVADDGQVEKSVAVARTAPGPESEQDGAMCPSPSVPRISSINGRFLLLNMHGALFHSDIRDLEEDITYARWMNAGAIRVFATDNNTFKNWSGRQVGNRIADAAPTLRANNVKLLVALVNNHKPVPGEAANSFGWMDDFDQLLLPFYTDNWRRDYLPFVRELISTVIARGARDVIFAWEPGNELHTTRNPQAILPFFNQVIEEIKKVDPETPILPGTMGVEHLNPGNPLSPLGPWMYCHAPVDGYTLHVYDWLSPQRQGDSTVANDLNIVLSQPCWNGRRLPVIVEELGTSRTMPGVYSTEEEEKRLQQELNQLRYLLSHPDVKVIGVGPWNAESPKVKEKLFYDDRRGFTSYGPSRDGSGSCYTGESGVRCRLEQLYRNLPALP